jgi:hypothetical protein
MKTVLVDPYLSDECKCSLASLGFDVREIPVWQGLSGSVSSHPDMLMALLPDGALLTGEEYYRENRGFFDSIGVCIVTDAVCPRSPYPLDVRFDALALGDTVYGKDGSVSEILTGKYKKFTSVKQGYARCSVAVIRENAVITADRGLEAALLNDGFRVLRIEAGHIALRGFDCGFIGGAGGALGDGRYCFFGDIATHPDGDAMAEFLEENEVTAVMLSGGPLSDHGGLLVI